MGLFEYRNSIETTADKTTQIKTMRKIYLASGYNFVSLAKQMKALI